MKNYYEILGVNRTASKDEIKKAFHKLAHRYHPDKKTGDEGKFKAINEAYQILSDDRKRQEYDAYGSSGATSGNTWDFSDFTRANGAGGMEFDFGDIFSEFFSGGRGRGQQVKRGRDISVDIQVTFQEAVFGVDRQVLIHKVSQCQVCQGNGAKTGSKAKKCQTCDGKGQIREARKSFLGTISVARDCTTCFGSGEVPEEKCSNCDGVGVVKGPEEIKVAIPTGIENGEMIRLANQGEAAPRGVSGDLYVRVHVEKHRTFRRDGLNLVMDLSVKLSDAILGAEYAVETLDGMIKVKIPAGISYGEILRVRSRGVPYRGGKRGDLLIRMIIKTPAKLSRQARKLIEDLKKEGI